MDTPIMPCIFFNHNGCAQPSCQFSHQADHRSIQIAPGRPNICKRYLLDPKGCFRYPGTCWYSHDILSSGHTSWQKLYNLLSGIRKSEFAMTGQHDAGSFVSRFMDMLIEERYARDGVVEVANDGLGTRSLIGHGVLERLGMGGRSEGGAGQAEGSQVVEIEDEPVNEGANVQRNRPNPNQPSNGRPRRPNNRPNKPNNSVKVKQEPGIEPATGTISRPAAVQNRRKKKKNKGNKENVGRGRGGGRGGIGRGQGHDPRRAKPGMSSEEFEERNDNYGFVADQLNTVLSYGMKPWDDGVWDVLQL